VLSFSFQEEWLVRTQFCHQSQRKCALIFCSLLSVTFITYSKAEWSEKHVLNWGEREKELTAFKHHLCLWCHVSSFTKSLICYQNMPLTMTNRFTGCGNENCVLSHIHSSKGDEIWQGIAGCVRNCCKGGTRFVWNYLYSEGYTHSLLKVWTIYKFYICQNLQLTL